RSHLTVTSYLFLLNRTTTTDIYPLSLHDALPISQSNALVLHKDSANNLTVIYYGKKLSDEREYVLVPASYKQSEDYTGLSNAAYTPSGSKNILEPAISVVHADGNKSLDLRYVTHKLDQLADNVSLLEVELKDPVYDFTVRLFYKSYFAEDVIEQWSVIEHNEKGAVLLEKFASANLTLKSNSYWLRQYHGDWAKEMQPEDSKITHGIKTIDSKLGTRANLFQPSSFMVSLDKPALEDEGT